MQIKELVARVTPVVNVGVVIFNYWKFLVGKHPVTGNFLFPGSRMKYDETPQEAALRVLAEEVPGVKAKLKKMITVLSDQGNDPRAYGITVYFLFDYLGGSPTPNKRLRDFKWVDRKEFDVLKDAYDIDKKIFNEVDLAVRTMNTTEDEILVEVNKNDKEIGTIVKREAHADPSRYHRGAHVMIFSSKGEAILQQRGLNKAHHPGRWDMPGGHQTAGTTIEQTAKQELVEELGVETELTLKRKGLYQDGWQSEIYYLYWGIHDGPYKFDKHEVEQVKAFDCKKLLRHEYDTEYSILEHVYDYVDELREVWEKLL